MKQEKSFELIIVLNQYNLRFSLSGVLIQETVFPMFVLKQLVCHFFTIFMASISGRPLTAENITVNIICLFCISFEKMLYLNLSSSKKANIVRTIESVLQKIVARQSNGFLNGSPCMLFYYWIFYLL